ncbi:MAG: hypothetical protein EP330_26365 [Deltaproteobacteria bacterium]|nr:MAG: hypothetical protein EP330_26365 [Deltaproteobacteria bacterium]
MRCFFLIAMLGGCAPEVEPSAACEAYVTCLGARDLARDRNTDVERFVAGGACWGSHEAAEFCTGACERGLDWLREAEADTLPTECSP